jgi:mannose-6-phosphate isomerase
VTSFRQPFLFERLCLPKVWGGRALAHVLGIDLPPGQAIGETWELYDRPGTSSRLRGESRTLADLLRADPVAVLGAPIAARTGGRLPILLKFLDARDVLSVQVHPDDELARAAGDNGKNEAWVVLHAEPDGRIRRGVRPGVTPDQFAAAASSAAIESLLLELRPKPGDAIAIPAGTVHAIGPGVVVFEVQQNSDVTYRLYDWGRPREVHLAEAMAAVRLAPPAAEAEAVVGLPDGGERIVAMRDFAVRRYRLAAGQELHLELPDRFATVTVLAGGGELRWQAENGPTSRTIARGDTALLPAALEHIHLGAAAPTTVLVCDPRTD